MTYIYIYTNMNKKNTVFEPFQPANGFCQSATSSCFAQASMRSPALGLHAIPFRSRFQLLDWPWNHLGWFNQLWDPEKIGRCFSHGFCGFLLALYLTNLQIAGLSWSMGWKSNHDFPWAKCLCRKILQLSLKILIDIGGSWSRATCSKMRFVSKKGVTKCHQPQYSSSSPGIKDPTSTAHHKNSGSRGKKTQTHGHTAHIICISRGLHSFRYSSYLPSTNRGTGKSYGFLSLSGGYPWLIY